MKVRKLASEDLEKSSPGCEGNNCKVPSQQNMVYLKSYHMLCLTEAQYIKYIVGGD